MAIRDLHLWPKVRTLNRSHVIYTEAQTLDEALQIIQHQKLMRDKKVQRSRARYNTRSKLRLIKNLKPNRPKGMKEPGLPKLKFMEDK